MLSHHHGHSLESRGRFKHVLKSLPNWPGFHSFQAFWIREDLVLVVERGCHVKEPQGRSLVLVDLWIKVPVGLVPDLNYLGRAGDYLRRMLEFYACA